MVFIETPLCTGEKIGTVHIFGMEIKKLDLQKIKTVDWRL